MDDIAERPDVPGTVAEISTAWLDEAISELPDLKGSAVTGVTEIGSGYGLAGSVARIELRTPGGQPSTAVLKQASRRNGAAELAFYRDVAPHLPCRVPRCYGGWVDADPEADRAVLVLEELPVCTQGDVLAGATADQARAVLGAAASFHAAFAHDAPPSLPFMAYPNDDLRRRLNERSTSLRQHHAAALPTTVLARIKDLPTRLEAASAVLTAAPVTLIHTDFHLDNVLFLDGGEPAVLDWPGARRGAAAIDVGRFLVEGVADAALPQHDALVAHYRGSRESAGAPVGEAFDDELNAALDLQLAHAVIGAGSPRPHAHPRMTELVETLVRRTALLLTSRDGGR